MASDASSALHGRLVHRIRRLRRREHRDRAGTFFVEGVRAFLEARDAGYAFAHVVHSRPLLRNPVAQKIVRRLKRSGVPTTRVPPETFRALSSDGRASGVGAILRQRWTAPADVRPGDGLGWLAMSAVQSAGNLGTLLRTAEAVGAAGLIALDDALDPHDPAVVRASMGGVFRLRLVRGHPALLARWVAGGAAVVAAVPPHIEARTRVQAYDELEWPSPRVLLLGHERSGLTDDELALATHAVTLPIPGRADSLNLGVAGSVLLYAMLRAERAGQRAREEHATASRSASR